MRMGEEESTTKLATSLATLKAKKERGIVLYGARSRAVHESLSTAFAAFSL